MIFLILAILCGASLAICFKLFRKLGIDTLQGVFFNYITAIAASLLMSGGVNLSAVLSASWTWLALVEGLLFMGGILVLAASTQRSGVAVTNVSARASMAIPVVASYLIYGEAAPDWLAIILLMTAMVLIFGNLGIKPEATSRKGALLPVAVFLVYGACDFLLKVLKAQAGADGNQGNIMLLIFGAACIFCMAAYLIRGNFVEHPFRWKAIPGGIVLGLFNSLCTAFMLKGLGMMDAVVFYPLYNAGVVLASLAAGVILFREKLRPIQLGGMALAILAIVLMVSAQG